MVELGKLHKLKVAKITSIGVYLNLDGDEKKEKILLPQKQVPENTNIGDEIEVFIYKDSEDRIIATIRKPKIAIGQLALLEVVQTTKIGAFLDWGLEKDLFLPFKEQNCRVKEGKKYLVTMYIDKSDRLAATMDIGKLLSHESPYSEEDKVMGTIYSIDNEVGAFVAVDNKYQGLVPKHEFYGDYECGDQIEVRIVKVKEDGKLDLSLRPKAYKLIDTDSEMILEEMDKRGGFLHLHDKSDPKRIKRELNMSKRAFKRAVGNLLKEGKINITDQGIEKKQ